MFVTWVLLLSNHLKYKKVLVTVFNNLKSNVFFPFPENLEFGHPRFWRFLKDLQRFTKQITIYGKKIRGFSPTVTIYISTSVIRERHFLNHF